MAPFGLPRNRFVRLVFSSGTIFFSHNNLARTVFSSQFQPVTRKIYIKYERINTNIFVLVLNITVTSYKTRLYMCAECVQLLHACVPLLYTLLYKTLQLITFTFEKNLWSQNIVSSTHILKFKIFK